MAYELLFERTKQELPHVVEWFEKKIDLTEFKEYVGGEETEEIIVDTLIQNGFPSNVVIKDVNFDFVVENIKDTQTLVVEYIDEQINLRGDSVPENIEEYFICKEHILNYRLNKLEDLKIRLVVNDDLADFMERHAYYDDSYVAKRLEEDIELSELINLIENREAMTLNEEYFMGKFSKAVSDLNLMAEDFDYTSTPIKVKRVMLDESFENVAEEFSYKLYNYGTLREYINSDLYKDLLKYDKVYYELELDIDVEEYMR